MKIAQANEYLQTLATIGAIVGLLVVGYEIRQSNVLATQQTKSQYWTNWVEMSTSFVDTDIYELLVKAEHEPKNLALAEQLRLEDYYWSYVTAYSHGVLTMEYTSPETQANILTAITAVAPTIFSGSYARAWFALNKKNLEAPVSEAIERGLKASSPNASLDYYNQLMTMIE